MVDLNKILSGLTQSGVTAGLAGGLAGGAISGALMSKKGRKTAGKLLKLGGIAAVGGLAWNAYRNYQEQQGNSARPAGPSDWQNLPQAGFDVEQTDQQLDGGNSLLIIRAMITAAVSDGHMDGAEQMRIFEHADTLPLSNEDKAMLFDELRNPKSPQDIVTAAREPAIAVEVYAASLLAIDESAPQAQSYLKQLSSLLRLPPELVDAIHAEAGADADGAHRAA